MTDKFKSQVNSMVTCSECGVRVHIDDAEASYNNELDDVFFYCSKCVNDLNYLSDVAEQELNRYIAELDKPRDREGHCLPEKKEVKMDKVLSRLLFGFGFLIAVVAVLVTLVLR